MPYCEQCGTEYKLENQFCENCGTRLAEPQPPIKKVVFKGNLQWFFLCGSCLILLLLLVTYNPNDLPFFTSHPNFPSRNIFGLYGAYLSYFLFLPFGKIIYMIPIFLLIYAGFKIARRNLPKVSGLLITTAILIILTYTLFLPDSLVFNLTGMLGVCLSRMLPGMIGKIAAFIGFLTLFIISLISFIRKKTNLRNI